MRNKKKPRKLYKLLHQKQKQKQLVTVLSSLSNEYNYCHFKNKMILFSGVLLLILFNLLAKCQSASTSMEQGVDQTLYKYDELERTTDYWLQSGRRALGEALKVKQNLDRAKNAIIFIGDGMSLSTVTAARILSGQLLNKSGEEEQLEFEKLNNVALIKTYNVDQQVPDSAATATAILCGVKANFYTLGVNANIKLNDTNCSRVRSNQVSSILKQAQDAGKSTGIVTNTRITHATPAAGYAHTSNRRWECDTHMPRILQQQQQQQDNTCKDIARQLIEDEPGSRLNVIMGGGRRSFFGPDYYDPGPAGQAGIRLDGRNLINQWIKQRREQNNENYAFVNCTGDLQSINVDKTDYLLGLFSYSHMAYEELRDHSREGEPSLSEMTEVAIRILSKNPLGYVLLVEGGRIDHAHHENVAGVALRETIALSWAVQAALKMIDQRDTLIGVTSDHAHALTINGLAPRGNPILGLSRYPENNTQLPYTTLLYGNGPGGFHRPRQDPTVGPNSTDSPYYVQHAAIHQEEAFHDGSDVAMFASGPYAHLFQGVQEQSYIAHVYAYALCLADYARQPHCRLTQQQQQRPPSSSSFDLTNTDGQPPPLVLGDSSPEGSSDIPTIVSGGGGGGGNNVANSRRTGNGGGGSSLMDSSLKSSSVSDLQINQFMLLVVCALCTVLTLIKY